MIFKGEIDMKQKYQKGSDKKTSQGLSFPHKMLNKALLVSLMQDDRQTQFIETNSSKDFPVS
jgi:hypothetical protein